MAPSAGAGKKEIIAINAVEIPHYYKIMNTYHIHELYTAGLQCSG